MDKVEVKKGDVIMFQANFEEAPNKINTARVTRVGLMFFRSLVQKEFQT